MKNAERETGAADPRRRIPSVSELLQTAQAQALVRDWSRPLVLEAIRSVLGEMREPSQGLGDAGRREDAIWDAVEARIRKGQSARVRRVVNATGILLHTGLGRAVLPGRAIDALARLNRCCNLQIDLDTGLRGKRNSMCGQLLCRLTGAEAATVVNNNAAATHLILSALCQGREVIVSRGQLIEIGGSFRLPDCIHQSGAKLVEVGTTNKTHLRDYENALGDGTGMILKVNPSNYRIVGFSQEVPVEDLVSLKKKAPVLIVDDLGCGALIDLRQYGLPKEPTVQESIAAGADIVCFSGDKLIGGPQAGIILGKKDLIEKIKKHPLSRMLRVCKLTDIALEQTLRLFLEPETLPLHNPILSMLSMPADALKARAQALKEALDPLGLELELRVKPCESATGGGSLPATPIPSWALSVAAKGMSDDDLCRRLRQNEPPIIARVADGAVQLDMRTLMDGDDEMLMAALKLLR